MIRRLSLLLALIVGIGLLPAGSVRAHNGLSSSNPADGATLAAAPSSISLVFTGDVPLDSVSMEIIDTSAVRTELTGFTHGPAGDTEVLAPLPALSAGVSTVRWRLVGPDGHVVSGRIQFTIEATTAAATTTVAVVPLDPVPTVDSVGFSEPWSTPGALRWLLRVVSYLAMLMFAGVVLAAAYVWPAAAADDELRRVMGWSLGVLASTALAQWLVVAGDIKAAAPWNASGGLSAALETDVGTAMLARLLLVAAIAAVLVMPLRRPEFRWRWIISLTVVLLGTWAWAGHAKSLRWPWLGVPLDIVHHAAAAAWLGGLAVVGWWTTRRSDDHDVVAAVTRFGVVARTAVITLAVTGALQSVRLDGGPVALFTTRHGALVLLKAVLLAVMLLAADVNRRRVAARLTTPERVSPRVLANLRRAMMTELSIGVLIVAITAGLVVTTPDTVNSSASPSTATTAATVPVATTTAANAPLVTSPPAVDAACTIQATSLQLGAVGLDVACLQLALQRVGVLEVGAASDSTFDTATDVAVRAFQAQQGLLEDGIVGRVTATALGIWSG